MLAEARREAAALKTAGEDALRQPPGGRQGAVDAPEALGVKLAAEGLVRELFCRVVAVLEHPGEVVAIEAVEGGDDGVARAADADGAEVDGEDVEGGSERPTVL